MHADATEATIVIGRVITFPGSTTDDASRSPCVSPRGRDGVFVVVTSGLLRKDAFIVIKNDAIAGIGKGAATVDETQGDVCFVG